MQDGERVPVVLVAAKGDVLNNIRDALGNINVALLCVQTKHRAIALLGRLTFDIDLLIIELELPGFDAWALIRQFTWRPEKPMKIIATSMHPKVMLGRVRERGILAVVSKATPPEEWRRTVETVLGTSKHTHRAG
jgi:CheY-like chemotaxis protein